jgi:chromosome partitioning ATPase
MSSDILSLVGLSQLRETIDTVKQGLNKDLKVLGILLNKFDKRTTLARDVEEMAGGLAEQISTKVFETKIRPGVAIAEAPAHGEDIFSYNKRSPAVTDYARFIEEIAEDIHLREVIG